MADPTSPDWDAFRGAMVEARRRSGLSRTELAQRVGWRGNAEIVRAFEAGELYPTVEVAAAMVDVLGVHLPGGEEVPLSADASQVPERIRERIEALPVIAAAIERCLDAWKAAGETAFEAAGRDDESCAELTERWGVEDLAEMLEVVAGRILTTLFGHCEVPLSMGREPWRAEEAAAALTAITVRHTEAAP